MWIYSKLNHKNIINNKFQGVKGECSIQTRTNYEFEIEMIRTRYNVDGIWDKNVNFVLHKV